MLILEKIASKLLRPMLSKFAHTKYISQSFFQSLASDSGKSFDQATRKFINSSSNDLSLSDLVLGERIRFVIAGGSDHDTLELPRVARKFHKVTFFIQNLCIPETKNVKLLPIGIEDLSWGKNGLPINFRKSLVERRKIRKVLVGPFGDTHPSRRELMSTVFESSSVSILDTRISHWQYSQIASRYLYVACPRGNGIDTHRFWETLYRGGIPIVISSPWSENLRSYNLPFLEISDWKDLNVLYLPPSDYWANYSLEFISTEWWRKRLT